MADLTFGQQVWLSVIDKAMLGTVGVVAATVAARWLEWYKSRQALIHATATTRFNKAEPLVQRFGDIETRVAHLKLTGYVRAKGLMHADRTIETPERMLDDPRHPEIVAGVATELQDRRTALTEAILELRRDLAAARFWLGDGVVGRMRTRLDHVSNSLGPRFIAEVIAVDAEGGILIDTVKGPTVEDLIKELAK